MLRRIVWLLIALPAGLLLVVLSVANRHAVRFSLDPFNSEAPVVSIELPFYVYLFAMLVIGVFMGGFATWLSQGRWRRSARTQGRAAARWQSEADRLTRERDAQVAAQSKQLAASGS